MFTGIIEELGVVERMDTGPDGARVFVRAASLLDGAHPGESIAVNGVCLTMTSADRGVFTADLSPETLRRTTLGTLRGGEPVNLERPLRVDQRLGGHIVQGHVDGVGTIADARAEGDGVWMEIAPHATLLSYLVEKGSIAVDGVSLTVARLSDGVFAVALIPHTLAATTLGQRRTGDQVNIEVDILAKYVQKLLEGVRAHD